MSGVGRWGRKSLKEAIKKKKIVKIDCPYCNGSGKIKAPKVKSK
jgi:hypothetical protein